ncbi:phenylacetaldehyde reductase-like isoform X2 [Salvia splendens]|uniref:phenylacetaldehyde reductase-like isoform X2 n=1 Tax=Salvia splendens TaxID=180675 RepID=UPI001C26E3FF|nr:phenylacetaldehyde reductase-like isoform X2 [Salvia splendens]
MEKVVCVTGASGYIASWLIKLLLQRRYTVKATVRNLRDSSKVAHLTSLEGANEKLRLYEADLLEEGSFDSAVDGCQTVFHTASPVALSVSDPQTQLIDHALKGTVNSCIKSSTINRVVITSSIASVMFNHDSLNLSDDVIVDETMFSDPIFCREKKEWYALSKTLAETATWKMARENGLDLVTLHPGFTIGPPLQPSLNLSCVALLNLIKQGKQLLPNGVYRYVDVRDVALAHIIAMENPSANGRYCLVGRVAYSFEAFDILKLNFPSLNLPTTENRPTKPPYQVSRKRAESLGISFRPLEESLKDSVECFRDRNLITL